MNCNREVTCTHTHNLQHQAVFQGDIHAEKNKASNNSEVAFCRRFCSNEVVVNFFRHCRDSDSEASQPLPELVQPKFKGQCPIFSLSTLHSAYWLTKPLQKSVHIIILALQQLRQNEAVMMQLTHGNTRSYLTYLLVAQG